MPESSPGPIARNRLAFRVVLGTLGAVQAVNGFWALFAPRSFYADFPFGRGWVEALPAYNEHLMRDVGGLFIGTAVILAAAAIWLERRLVAVAIVSWLAFAIPHTVYHLFNLEPYDAGDAIGNAVTLALTVVLPLAMLFLLWRDRGPAATLAARPADGNGRIAGVPADSRNRSSASPIVPRGGGPGS